MNNPLKDAPDNTANRTGPAKGIDKNRPRTGELSLEQILKAEKRRKAATPEAPKSDEERGASAPT